MSTKKIITFVHTEYHLLLFINRLISESKAGIQNLHSLFIRDQGKSRVSLNLDLTNINAEIFYVSEEFVSHKKLSEASKNKLEELFLVKPDEFVFYQEMDLLMVILANYWKKQNQTKIVIYQDGLKPYNILKFNSLSLMAHHHQTNIWLKKNGFTIDSWFSPFWSHRYAYLNAIDEVYLTFPEAYINWNNKKIQKIEFPFRDIFKSQLSEVFHWDDTWIQEKENIILYMSQPMHDDGKVETEFINALSKKFDNYKIYVKPHPLTPQIKLDEYAKFNNFKILNIQVPAELLIMQLKNSIILSINSTSMFLDNPNNRFYYLHKIFEKDIKRLQRYDIKIHPAPHIKLALSIGDIKF